MNALLFLFILILLFLIADKWVNRYKNIYFIGNLGVVGRPHKRRFYKMIQPAGSWHRRGCEHYALWKPVNRFLWIFWTRRAENIWLDMEGFEKFNGQPMKRLTSMKLYVNY